MNRVPNVDEFKTVIAVSIVVSLVFLGVIIAISENSVSNASIPDVEYGKVTAKGPSDVQNANYTINLAGGKVLYVQGNQTLYDGLEIGKTYVFTCRIDIPNGMTIAESAWQTNRTST